MANDWIKIGAMWINKQEDGSTRFGTSFNEDDTNSKITLSDVKNYIKIFKNDYKEKENHPDYNFFIHKDKLMEITTGSTLVGEAPDLEPEAPVEDKDLPF